MSLEPGPSNGTDSPRRRSWWVGLATGSVKGKSRQVDVEPEDAEEVMLPERLSDEQADYQRRGLPPAYDTVASSTAPRPSDPVKPKTKLKKGFKGVIMVAGGQHGDDVAENTITRLPGASNDSLMEVTTQTVRSGRFQSH